MFWYIICIKGGSVYLYTWKELFQCKCMQHWPRGFKMCPADRFTVLERDVSSSTLLPRLKAQVVGQVKDTRRTPAQNYLITTWDARQAQYSNSILRLKSNNVSIPLRWSANFHKLWIHWCLRMINQLMWHPSWNPSGLLTDSIFEMQLPSLTHVLAGRWSWCFSKEDQAF